jgi:hypothetical protein
MRNVPNIFVGFLCYWLKICDGADVGMCHRKHPSIHLRGQRNSVNVYVTKIVTTRNSNELGCIRLISSCGHLFTGMKLCQSCLEVSCNVVNYVKRVIDARKFLYHMFSKRHGLMNILIYYLCYGYRR